MQKILSTSTKTMNLLARLSGATWGMKFRATTAVYRAAFLGSALYACGAWAWLMRRPDRDALRRAQRTVLIRVLKAYRTVSTDALLVVAGALPIDLEITRRALLHMFRRGADYHPLAPQDVVTRLENLDPQDTDGAQSILDDYVIQQWEVRWAATTKAGQTKKFFPDIKSRMEKDFISPTHWTVQLLTGHGKFAEKLAGFRLKDSGNCLCGMPETPDHVLFSCTRYDAIRSSLYRRVMDYAPTHATLVSSEENFKALEDFAKKWAEISPT